MARENAPARRKATGVANDKGKDQYPLATKKQTPPASTHR